jgi:clan AA aspartic protease (TIGR02281 family)
MEKVGRTYRLPCTVNGLSLNFILDTGADEVSISLSEALFMLKNGYIDENDLLNTEYYQLANGEIVEGTKLVLRTLKIGGLTIKNVEASIVHTMNAPLLLGQSALSKLGMITIDYAKNQLIINEQKEVYATQKGTALDYFLLGNESFNQSNFSLATEYYSKAIEINNKYLRAYYNRGTALSKLKDHKGAISDYNKAIELNHDFADAYYNRGNSKYELNDYQGAINDYTKAIELDSNDNKAYFNRGNSFKTLKKYDLAIKDYSKSIELDSNDKSAYLNRGNSFFSLDKYDLAIKDYSTSLMIDANYTTAYFYRGLVNNIIKKNKEAIIDFNKAIELNNKNEYYYYRGLAFYDFGDQNKACSDWKTALAEGYQGAEKMIEKYCGETFAEISSQSDSKNNLLESFTDLRNQKKYKTVTIGTQTWMAENLNVSTFRNGDTIPEVKTPLNWELAFKNKQPAWCYYENNPENAKKYGKMYNWFAVNDSRGLAPEGWQISTDSDWLKLELHLGIDAGKKLKSSIGWISYSSGINYNGTNSSGFSGLPGGCRLNDGFFHLIEYECDFWAISNENNNDVYLRKLHSGNTLGKSNASKGRGLYVRCVKN